MSRLKFDEVLRESGLTDEQCIQVRWSLRRWQGARIYLPMTMPAADPNAADAATALTTELREAIAAAGGDSEIFNLVWAGLCKGYVWL